MMAKRVLIIEDEASISDLLKEYFEHDGFEVSVAPDGMSALSLYQSFDPQMIVLDRMLPGISGDQVCQEIRRMSQVPIMMLTAKSDEASRIEGFELGVDDYVTKPFSAREVIFRVQALMKRSYPESKLNGYSDGYLTMDFDQKKVMVEGLEVHLTANEMSILEVLYTHQPRPLSRSQLVDQVFGYGYEAYERNMDTYIKNIRQKVEVDAKNPMYVLTKYGIGYYFEKRE